MFFTLNKVVKCWFIFLILSIGIHDAIAQDDDTIRCKNSFAIAGLAYRGGWLAVSPTRFPIYGLGIQYRRHFSMRWSLETGLYQTSKIVTDEFTGKISYRYLMVPLNLRYDRENFYFSAGAYSEFLFLVNAGQSTYSPLAPHRYPDIGYNLGVGYKRNISESWKAFLEFRHFRGLYEPRAHYIFRSFGLGLGVGKDF